MTPKVERKNKEVKTQTLVFRVSDAEKKLIERKMPANTTMSKFLLGVVKGSLGLK